MGCLFAFSKFMGQSDNEAIKITCVGTIWPAILWPLVGMVVHRIFGDIEKESVLEDLTKLSYQLKQINVNTSRDLLLDSKEYDRRYPKKFPYIVQEKYIMVPTYNNGEITETSILQEHVIGTDKYILSIGTPTKVYKLAYAKA